MSQSETPEAGDDLRLSAWPIRALKAMVAVFLFAMAALTFVDVIGRYVFSAPVPGTFETVGLLLGLVTFSALPLITQEQSHITVDLFDHFIRGRFRQVQQFVVLLASAGMALFIAERLWSTGRDEWAANYVTEYFGISRVPLLYFLSALSLVTFVILLIMIWRYAKDGFKPTESGTDDPSALGGP
jgi:TRAP-type C4-dicarboxylate transport system permease small subunit